MITSELSFSPAIAVIANPSSISKHRTTAEAEGSEKQVPGCDYVLASYDSPMNTSSEALSRSVVFA